MKLTSVFRHLGALGLFFLAMLDSTPLPTFGGPDFLIAFLAGGHHTPWYECALMATAGSVAGAYLTFRVAHKAGAVYLNRKFGAGRVSGFFEFFKTRGTGTLAATTAVPFPFPTSMFFAAAGASNYDKRKFLAVVTTCRAARYSMIAVLADLYGRHFIRVLRHPVQYWPWMLLFAVLSIAFVVTGILLNRRLSHASASA